MIEFRKIGFTVLLLVAILFSAKAQLDTVRIRIIGLTCSSCSKSVEEKLIKIEAVKSVKMHLNSNEAVVIVDFSKNVNWLLFSKAVYDAGFSVGSFIVPKCSEGGYKMNIRACSEKYFFVGDPSMVGVEKPSYILVGRNFMDKKTYKEWQQKILLQGYADPSSVSYYYYY